MRFLKIPQKIRKYIGSQMGDELKFGEILGNFWARGEILKSCEVQKTAKASKYRFFGQEISEKWRNSEQMSKIVEKRARALF